MSFISYAQNAEDVLLWRALGHIHGGFYIDVGASDPEEHSVTKSFYDAGWRGINIEPLPSFHQAFLEQRPRDINLAIAAGASNGELTLYDTPQVRGWASPLQSVAELHRTDGHEVAEMTVLVRTLASVCEEYVQDDIHFLKIDVEGFEGEVLRGMDFTRWRPWVLVIEATLPNSRETNHEAWDAIITGQRYGFAWFDGLNRYYVAEEHSELLQHFGIQPNVFDAFISHHLDKAWKNGRDLEKQLRASAQDAQRLVAWQRELERELHKSQAQRRDLDEQLLASQQNVRKLAAQLQERMHLLERRTEQLQASQARARKLKQELRAARLKADEATEALAPLQETLAAANAANRHLAEWARGLEERLLATLASTSWKLTRPVRMLGAIVIALRRPKLVRRVVIRLTGNERLRRLVIPVLRRHPAIGERVSASIAAVKLDPPQQASAGTEIPEELKNLPVSVRKVLTDLQRARANQHTGQ